MMSSTLLRRLWTCRSLGQISRGSCLPALNAPWSSNQCYGNIFVSCQCSRGGVLCRSYQLDPQSDLPRYDQASSKRVIVASTVLEMADATQELIASLRGLQHPVASESSQLLQSKAAVNGVLGFDCEWRPMFTKGSVQIPALLQLASDTVCILVRLCCLGKSESVPEILKRLLASEKVLKVGISARQDAILLRNYFQLDVRGIFELSLMRITLGVDPQGYVHSLRRLTETCLKCHLSKSAQMSNWTAKKLLESQVRYAANDVHVAVDIFRLLEEKLVTLIGTDSFQSVVYLLTDVLLTGKQALYLSSLGATLSQPQVDVRELLEEELMESMVPIPEYSPPTELTRLVDSSGHTICTCVRTHADWCTAQKIGDEVESDDGEVVVRLREDAPIVADATLEGACASLRSHRCVVCGSREKLRHCLILPEPYWRCLTKVAKDAARHDDILLCPTCYYFKNLNDWHRVKRMMSKYQLPFPVWPFHQLNVDVDHGRRHVRSLIRSLRDHPEKLTESRRAENTATLARLCNVQPEEITDEFFESALDILRLKSTDGSALMSMVCETAEGIHMFCRQWRMMFLERLKPLCLPPSWSESYKYAVELPLESTKSVCEPSEQS